LGNCDREEVDVATETTVEPTTGAGEGETLSFLGLTNIAVRLVQDEYPGAKLLEGDGIPPGGPTTNPKDVTSWRFVFRTASGGTAFIYTTVWGEFTPVEYVPKPWVGDIVIPWPIKMDIVEADKLLKGHGYTSPYRAVTLQWPLAPGNEQPFYIFGFGPFSFVFVGIYDGSVTPHNVTNSET
jgi:hypothetical protein